MALVSFEEAIRSLPKNKLFVADTSFIIKSLIQGTPESKFRNVAAGKIGFIYNVVIRKEILHYVRYQMMVEALDKGTIKVNKNITYIFETSEEHSFLKALCDNGYAELFREVFGKNGELLRDETAKALAGFTYGDSKQNKNASNWDNVCALMALYGLDSSDAMILNFAVGDATYSGVITSDADFRVCGDVQSKNSFDIILPRAAKDRVASKNWRAN